MAISICIWRVQASRPSAKVIGPHCGYSPVTRIAGNSNSSIAELKIVHDDEDYTAVSVEDLEGGAGLFHPVEFGRCRKR